jgi:hypothetical protein
VRAVILSAAGLLAAVGLAHAALASNAHLGAHGSRAVVATTKPKPKPASKVKIIGSPAAGEVVFDADRGSATARSGPRATPDPIWSELTKTQIENVAAFVVEDVVKT